jgi:hypothetical protein
MKMGFIDRPIKISEILVSRGFDWTFDKMGAQGALPLLSAEAATDGKEVKTAKD